MYATKVQILKYGPIDHLDIRFPFESDTPKPVVFVGENGTGKSIVLSHIVNGLASAQSLAFPATPDVERDRVFKVRSNSYIKSGGEYYFGRVDFEEGLYFGELVTKQPKREYETLPPEIPTGLPKDAWNQMTADTNDRVVSNLGNNDSRIREIFSRNCVLYFPSNRFEEPAWLNVENLTSPANYMDLTHVQGHTNRKMISYSPLHENQNWLFDVIYDRIAFEGRTTYIPIKQGTANSPIILRAILSYSGTASSIYEVVLDVLRRATRTNQNTALRIGSRLNRVVSLVGDEGLLVPNIFQLSSGETSILNLFLSILRDFDLSGASFGGAESVRGIAVVDEIDLHLHAVHQYDILPELMRMFPRVQFIVTTHSPLIALGMRNVFGEDGFALYQLPHGEQIDPEEFSEFASAYQTYSSTSRFSSDVRSAVKDAQTPLLYVEGTTNRDYLEKAAQLLGRPDLLGAVRVLDGGGDGDLKNIWRAVLTLSDDVVPNKVVVLFDCDYQGCAETKGNRFKRTIPRQCCHPLKKGIENLFDRQTLERAKHHKPAFIDIVDEHPRTIRGSRQVVDAEWTVNEDEKRNLCDWLCQNGTAEDFRHFESVFDVLAEILQAGQRDAELGLPDP